MNPERIIWPTGIRTVTQVLDEDMPKMTPIIKITLDCPPEQRREAWKKIRAAMSKIGTEIPNWHINPNIGVMVFKLDK